MYFEVLSGIRFRKHPSQSSLYFNGAEYFYRQIWSSNYLFLRVCVLYVLYDSWVSTDLSVSIKTTTTVYLFWNFAKLSKIQKEWVFLWHNSIKTNDIQIYTCLLTILGYKCVRLDVSDVYKAYIGIFQDMFRQINNEGMPECMW